MAFIRNERSEATSAFPIDPDAIAHIPEDFALRYDVLGVGADKNALVIAVPDPDDCELLDRLRFATGLHVYALAAPREIIRSDLAIAYRTGGTVGSRHTLGGGRE